MSDSDAPMHIDKNDERYRKAIANIQLATIGYHIARDCVLLGGLDEAKTIVADIRALMTEAEEIVMAIGNIEGAMRIGRTIQILDGRIDELKEMMGED